MNEKPKMQLPALPHDAPGVRVWAQSFVSKNFAETLKTTGTSAGEFSEGLSRMLLLDGYSAQNISAAPDSFYKAISQAARDGLVPQKNCMIASSYSKEWGTSWQYQRFYQGLLEILLREGVMISGPEIAHENDTININKSIVNGELRSELSFSPYIKGDRGKVIGGVMFWKSPDQSHWDGRFITLAQIHEARSSSKNYKFTKDNASKGQKRGEVNPHSPWVKHFTSMALKTVFLRCMNWVKLPERAARVIREEREVEALEAKQTDGEDNQPPKAAADAFGEGAATASAPVDTPPPVEAPPPARDFCAPPPPKEVQPPQQGDNLFEDKGNKLPQQNANQGAPLEFKAGEDLFVKE